MIDVTCAIIIRDTKILIAKRAAGSDLQGKWEFPGGKVEQGETPEQCLARELHEEFGINTSVGSFVTESIFHYKEKSIRLLAYMVEYLSGELILTVHDEIKWIGPDEFDSYDMAEADIPIVNVLRQMR
jgi:8-oxo-dGTP diphosphatase